MGLVGASKSVVIKGLQDLFWSFLHRFTKSVVLQQEQGNPESDAFSPLAEGRATAFHAGFRLIEPAHDALQVLLGERERYRRGTARVLAYGGFPGFPRATN